MTEYDKQFMKQLANSLKQYGLLSNSTGKFWGDDNGFYIYLMSIRSCPIGGVFVETGVQFFWKDNSVHTFGFYFSYGWSNRFVLSRYGMPWGSFDTKKIAETPGAYEEIETAIYRIIEAYRDLKNLSALHFALKNRNDLFYLNHRNECNINDVNLGVTKYLLGDFDGAERIFENVTNDAYTTPFKERMLELCRAKTIDYEYLNSEITKNRIECRTTFKKLPVSPDGYFK